MASPATHHTEVNIKNRRATFDYAISETFTAGIVLTGTEIKALRTGKAGLVDTFCYVTAKPNLGVWVKNMYISEYFYGTYNNHESRRDRKLLLNKREIARLQKAAQEPGVTIIPMRVFINDRGLAKMVIGIGRGKKEYDKRQAIKERDDKRSMARLFQK
ncbi:MAG: SsrA-binding protein SmpB [Paramuribaculum sp.]|nr:SsrA-binding protein SmpB [Paramuribaculum sp.]